MSMTEKAKTPTTEHRSPLYRLAVVLSVVSAAWTAYSSWDLLDRHPMALVAGGTYDILWMSLVYTDWKSRIGGKETSSFPGWAMLIPVVALLTWHGHEAWGAAGAIAGPFLAIGTKVLWHKAIEDSVDEVTIKKNAAAKTINILDTETDIIMETAEAEIRKETAEAEAEHQRTLAEKHRAHELKMADLSYAEEEKKVTLENRNDRMLAQIESASMEKVLTHLERLANPNPTTITGETVRTVGGTSTAKAITTNDSSVQASSAGRPGMLTMHIGHDQQEEEPLTEAQENRKRIAALYYLYSDDAEARGGRLTQTAFADSIGTTKVQVSRSCTEFPRHKIGDIEVYREEMGETG